MIALIALISVLNIKHFVADFPLQTSWMAKTKGIYGHRGGLIHAGIHAALTFGVLVVFGVPLLAVLVLVAVEWVIHYHIDWAKQAYTIPKGLTPADSQFWVLIGFDQLLHQLTYVGLVYVVFEYILV